VGVDHKQIVSGAANFTGGIAAILGGTFNTGSFIGSQAGTFNESAGQLNVTGAGSAFSFTGSGSSFNLSGGAVAVTNSATLAGAADTISSGTFTAGTLAVGGKLTLSGGALNSSGATTLSNGTLLIQSLGALSTASLAISGGTFTESAGLLTATGLASFTGGSDTIAGGTFNAGSLSVLSGSLSQSGGSVAINAGAGNLNVASGGTFFMSGTSAVLNANGGIADNGTLIGFGTVKGVLSGKGNVEAHNGLLDLTSNIGSNTGLGFQIDGGSLSRMQLDGAVGSGNSFKFLATGGVLVYNNNNNKGINVSITGLNVGSNTNPTNFIDFKQYTVTVSGSQTGSGTSGIISLSDGSTLNLPGLVGNTAGSWFVNTKSDGGTGTDVFLSTAPPPATPSTPVLLPASDSGSSSTDDITNVTTPTFIGTAAAGSTVTILRDGAVVGSGVAIDGSYSIVTSALTNGTHRITATATGTSGDVSAASSALSVTIDTTAPTIASFTTSGLGIVNGNGDLNASHVVTITLTADAVLVAGVAAGASTLRPRLP
jgi:hypothetical protein